MPRMWTGFSGGYNIINIIIYDASPTIISVDPSDCTFCACVNLLQEEREKKTKTKERKSTKGNFCHLSLSSSDLNMTMVTMEGDSDEQKHKPEAGGDPWNGAAEAAGTPGSASAAGFEDDFSPAAAAGANPEVKGDLERLPDSEEYLAGLEAK